MDELRPEAAPQYSDGDRATPWEARVAALASEFAYPPTPDLTVRGAPARRFGLSPAWAVAMLVVVMALALLAVPQVRAAVVRVFQLGVVHIFVTEPSPAGTEAPAPTPQPAVGQSPVTATPFIGPPPTALPGLAATAAAKPAPDVGAPPALAGLAGRTTLVEAERLVPFPIALPGYPADLGPPDYVFVQDHAASVLILAWSDPAVKGGVGLSLWTFLPGTAIDKIEPETVAETTVDGQRALWTQGEHLLFMRNGDLEARRLVLGNTLIWERKNLTFRLETFLPLEEAVQVAESVR